MKLEIGKQCKDIIKYRNKFVIRVETMEGDADDEHEFELAFKPNETDKILRTIICLERCRNEYLSGKGGYDDYWHIPDFEELLSEEWFSYEGTQDSFEEWYLTFFDENGTEFNVKSKFTKEEKHQFSHYEGRNVEDEDENEEEDDE